MLKYRHTTPVCLTVITSILQNNRWLYPSFIFSCIFNKYLLVLWSGKKKKPRKNPLFHNLFKKRHWAQFLAWISRGNYPPPGPLASSLSPPRSRREADRSMHPEWQRDTKRLPTRRWKHYHCDSSSWNQTEDAREKLLRRTKESSKRRTKRNIPRKDV